MITELPYGKDRLALTLPDQADILSPRFVPGLEGEAAAFRAALASPLGTPALADQIRPGDSVAIVIPDITRALPSERLLAWLFAELPWLTPANVVIVIGTGTHRPNTPEEIRTMVGEEIAGRYEVINHVANDPATLSKVGENSAGQPIYMNSRYVSADKRIIMGFIEPHFMAGFSGGYKAVFPGIADLDSIMHYHRALVIGDPLSTWGNMKNNPTQDQVRFNGAQAGVDFCINVTLNRDGAITGFFCGETMTAHDAGCDFARDTAMVRCASRYPIVITSNSGYPLDQNLYQSVKGMSAAAQIVEEGGLIVMVARCNDGFPDHGNFRRLLFEYPSPQAFLDALHSPGFRMQDQWQNQLLALIQLRARVAVCSGLPAAELERAHFEPVADLDDFLHREIALLGSSARIAVLPEGPMTIPYV